MDEKITWKIISFSKSSLREKTNSLCIFSPDSLKRETDNSSALSYFVFVRNARYFEPGNVVCGPTIEKYLEFFPLTFKSLFKKKIIYSPNDTSQIATNKMNKANFSFILTECRD